MIPSTCWNQLTVSGGTSRQLDSFRQFVEGIDPNVRNKLELNEFCLHSIVPIPIQVVEYGSQITLEKYRVSLWGIASNAMGTNRTLVDGELRYCFVTAETFPKPVLENLISKFPHLNFSLKYENSALNQSGHLVGKNGFIQ